MAEHLLKHITPRISFNIMSVASIAKRKSNCRSDKPSLQSLYREKYVLNAYFLSCLPHYHLVFSRTLQITTDFTISAVIDKEHPIVVYNYCNLLFPRGRNSLLSEKEHMDRAVVAFPEVLGEGVQGCYEEMKGQTQQQPCLHLLSNSIRPSPEVLVYPRQKLFKAFHSLVSIASSGRNLIILLPPFPRSALMSSCAYKKRTLSIWRKIA